MRKLTATLMAGAAAAVAVSTGASATGPALLAGTYLAQETTTGTCDGRPAGLNEISVFNFAGFGKVGDYTNTSSTASVPGNFPAIGFSTYSTGIPTGFGTGPGATGSWTYTETLVEEGDLGGSYLNTTIYSVPATSSLMFVDKNTSLGTTADATGCTASETFIRVGK